MRLKNLPILALIVISLLLPTISLAQSKQRKTSNKQKISAKKQSTPAPTLASTPTPKEEVTQPTPSVTPETQVNTNVTPKKRTLETSDIEAYGLAPEVKSKTQTNSQNTSVNSGSTSSKPSGQGRKGRYGISIPASPTPKN